MVELTHGLFRVILLTPTSKLLDCRAGSVIVPVSDGQWGILRNHCPMLAQLTLGILQVRQIMERADAVYILEGGFVRVTENHVTILAYDALTFEGKEPEQVRQMVLDAQSVLAGKERIRVQQGKADVQRARLIVRMVRLAGLETVLAESPV